MSEKTDLDFELPADGMLPGEAEDLKLHVLMCGRRYRALRFALDRGHETFAALGERMKRLEYIGIAIAAVLVSGEIGVMTFLKSAVLAAARSLGG